MIRGGNEPMSSRGNAKKIKQIEQALAELLVEVLKPGFHGTATLEFTIQDGTIQHFHRRVDQLER
jgi:hypothetical protein